MRWLLYIATCSNGSLAHVKPTVVNSIVGIVFGNLQKYFADEQVDRGIAGKN